MDNLHCFICNSRAGVSVRNAVSIFSNENVALKSGNSLHDVMSRILGIKINETNVHSSIMCKKCYKSCSEYDELDNRLTELRKTLMNQFKTTISKSEHQYESILKTEKGFQSAFSSPAKKIVLPASQLKPLPPNYVIINKNQVNINETEIKPHIVLQKEPFQIKPKLEFSSIRTLRKHRIIKTDTKNPKSKDLINTENTLERGIIEVDILDSALLTNTTDEKIKMESGKKAVIDEKVVTDLCNIIADHDTKGQPMEIDEECTANRIIDTSELNEALKAYMDNQSKNESKQDNSKLFEIPLLRNLDTSDSNVPDTAELNSLIHSTYKSSHVISKVEYVDLDNEIDCVDENTILMEQDENGAIIRVVKGQNVLYQSNEVSLLTPQESSDVESITDDNEESKDSNDETQIELQMSGDKETAAAVMMTAKATGLQFYQSSDSGTPIVPITPTATYKLLRNQTQGSAFIKDESGRLYRVKTTEGSAGDVSEKSQCVKSVVEKVAKLHNTLNTYKCVLCASTDESLKTDDDDVQISAYVTNDAQDMMRHVKVAHNSKVYICNICGEVIKRRFNYTKHMKDHAGTSDPEISNIDGTKQYQCTLCTKKFASRNFLLEHMNYHSGIRPYTCDVCDKSFASKYTHQAHCKTHEDRPRPFKCNKCGKSFFTAQNLSQHHKTHTGIKDYICKVCGKGFGTHHNLEVHSIVHTGQKPFDCNICKKAFARRAEIRDHMRTHTGERPFHCDICSATFSQRSNLQSHRRATHFDDKRHACSDCDKRFKRRRLLDYHIKASHTGERPYRCDVCKATFVYPEHFKKHSRIHSGERPFTCEVCNKSFTSRDNRNAHRFVHSDKKPYECLVCGAGYMRKPLLYAHMNTSGHLTETIVVNQPRVLNQEKKPDEGILLETLDESVIEQIKEERLNGKQVENDTQTDSQNVLAQDSTRIIASVEPGGIVRLVQVQLADGENGWVAIN